MPRTNRKRRKTTKRVVRRNGKVLHGAARAAVLKARKRKSPARRKPRRNPTPTGTTYGPMKKRRRTAKQKAALKRMQAANRKGKKRAPARSAKKRKPTVKRKSAKRVAAGKKAARTRKRNLAAKKRTPTRKRTTRRKAVARPRRRRRSRARQVRKYRSIRRRGTAQRRRSPSRKRGRRVAKTARRARRTVLYQRAYGNSATRSWMKRHRLTSNPKKAIIEAIKMAAPIAISLYGARAISRGLFPRIPGIDRLGRHAAPVASVALLAVGAFATKKGKLAKHRQSILLGLGLNVIDVVTKAYMPASVKAYIGMGATPLYDGPMGEYVGVGGVPPLSEPMGEYIEMGDYIEMGASEELGMGLEQELGLEAEMGMGGAALQIGTGIGNPWPSMEKPVPQRAFSAPVPQRSFIKQVPEVGPGYDSASNLYTGVFAGGGFGPSKC
jgi:hypothetical protein